MGKGAYTGSRAVSSYFPYFCSICFMSKPIGKWTTWQVLSVIFEIIKCSNLLLEKIDPSMLGAIISDIWSNHEIGPNRNHWVLQRHTKELWNKKNYANLNRSKYWVVKYSLAQHNDPGRQQHFVAEFAQLYLSTWWCMAINKPPDCWWRPCTAR
jgi:hypothetical protein